MLEYFPRAMKARFSYFILIKFNLEALKVREKKVYINFQLKIVCLVKFTY
jgi:hypothetical protein